VPPSKEREKRKHRQPGDGWAGRKKKAEKKKRRGKSALIRLPFRRRKKKEKKEGAENQSLFHGPTRGERLQGKKRKKQISPGIGGRKKKKTRFVPGKRKSINSGVYFFSPGGWQGKKEKGEEGEVNKKRLLLRKPVAGRKRKREGKTKERGGFLPKTCSRRRKRKKNRYEPGHSLSPDEAKEKKKKEGGKGKKKKKEGQTPAALWLP